MDLQNDRYFLQKQSYIRSKIKHNKTNRYQDTMSLKYIEAETRLEACYRRVGSGKKINDKPALGDAREVAPTTTTSRSSVGLAS